MTGAKIYTTPGCPWCAKTKEFFRNNKIKFIEIDVSKSSDKAKEMIKKSGQIGVPVTIIGNEIIVGFDEDKLRKILKTRKRK